MNIPEAIGILALVYVVNITLVECLNIKPYWMVFVPGLPVALVAGYIVLFAVCIAVAVIYGLAIGCAVFGQCIKALWQMKWPPRIEEAVAHPELELV